MDSMPKQIAPGLFHDAGPSLDRIPASAMVAIAKVRNEGWRLPFWLAYHRWLGVEHFVVVDNRSTDRTRAVLVNEFDVTLLQAPGPFRGPTGYHNWIEVILAAAPQHRWNLVLDADELFVVAPWRKGGLRDLAEALESDDADVISAVMVDCYPTTLPYREPVVPIAPWLRAPWFDRGPYVRWNSRKRRPQQYYHGVRQRIFWPNWYWQRHIPKIVRKQLAISSPPAILKAPFFRKSLGQGSAFHRSSHSVSRHGTYLAYILHYKLDIDLEKKIGNAIAEGQYYNNSSEYRVYGRKLSNDVIELKCDRSRRFTGYDSLIDAELCHRGRAYASSADQLAGGVDMATAQREIRDFGGPSTTDTVDLPDAIEFEP
jgi:glycosyltransferase involved in cell wall biosynthesis